MSATLEEIFAAIRREREYQTAKWGSVQEHPHEVMGYIGIMQSELAEAHQAWCKGRFGVDDLREVLQVVAVAVACLEQHGVVEREEIVQAQDAICCPWCGDLVGTVGETIIHLVVKHKRGNEHRELTDNTLVDLVRLITKDHAP